MTGLELVILTCLAGNPKDCTPMTAIDSKIVQAEIDNCAQANKLGQMAAAADPRAPHETGVQHRILCDADRKWSKAGPPQLVIEDAHVTVWDNR